MNDQDTINPWHILNAVIGAFVALLTWVGNKQVSRIESLEKSKASSEEVDALKKLLNDSINQLYARAEERHTSLTNRLDRILENQRRS